MVSSKLNAAGMTAEQSMLLPEREVQGDEHVIMEALCELYGSAQPNEDRALRVFSSDVIYSSPRGDVYVGHPGLRRLLAAPSSSRQVYHRVLVTPQSLPADALVVDQVVVTQANTQAVNDENSSAQDQTNSTRSLLVLKRRDGGMVCSLTEEEGHKRATAPLGAISGVSNNFYSPTDSMVSPCTSKLNLAKRKHHTKAKPMNLFASHMGANAGANARKAGGAPAPASSMEF